MQLKDKVVLITGASSGIGKATALAFARQGAKVIVNYYQNKSGAEQTAAAIAKLGTECLVVEADVSNPAMVNQMLATARDVFGQIDILVNNAGYTEQGDFFKTEFSEWEEILKVNLLGTMYMSQQVALMMKEVGSGVILNNSSVYGIDYGGNPYLPAYSAAKAGIINFTKTLAKLVAPRIRVNVVAPGYTITPAWDGVDEEYKEASLAKTYTKEWITAEQIADAFVFLAQHDAITGQVLTIDGGYSLK
jgi:3-oxoacyl-[acyl-carrier protein] reductase